MGVRPIVLTTGVLTEKTDASSVMPSDESGEFAVLFDFHIDHVVLSHHACGPEPYGC